MKTCIFEGNVKNGYFHFEAMTDIDGFVTTLLMLLCIDALSLVFSSIFLKMTCNINMLQVKTYPIFFKQG